MHIIIIGNGISGITCARHIRKLCPERDIKITIVSKEAKYFYARTALMYIYMGQLTYEQTKPYEDWFWAKNRLDIVQDCVLKVNTTNKSLELQSGAVLYYDKLAIASGSVPKRLDNCPGQDLQGVQSLYHYQDLALLKKNTLIGTSSGKQKRNIKKAVIIGGGLIGIELAEMLQYQKISVVFLIREKWLAQHILPEAEARLISRHIKEDHYIDLRTETEVQMILSDNNTPERIAAVLTNKGETIVCEFAGLTIGVQANIVFLKDNEIERDKGILINSYMETNISDVYALGDCAQFRQALPNGQYIEQTWYSGHRQGICAAHNIVCPKSKTYDPGIDFNSARFFDIGYQSYGYIPTKSNPSDLSSYYWQHQNEYISLRLVFKNNSQKTLAGILVLGMQLRQEVVNSWLEQNKSVDEVIKLLRTANFDAEFSKKYYKDIKRQFEQQSITRI